MFTRDALKSLANQLDRARLGELAEIQFPSLLDQTFSETVKLGLNIRIMAGIKTVMCVVVAHLPEMYSANPSPKC